MAGNVLPKSVERLIHEFARLPGIGPKSASRLTFYLLRVSDEQSLTLAEALSELKTSTQQCSRCWNITEIDPCPICSALDRDHSLLCVVEEPLDVVAIERSRAYNGRYHVLHGVISPIEGIGPDDLKILELIQRVENDQLSEIIVATNATLEGDTTALYIQQRLAPYDIKITRLARGLPVGGDLEYTDDITLTSALDGRQELR
jgi:recombination protein RecR